MNYNDIVMVNQSIKTTDIKGKEYAEVNQRIKAFRMICPNGTILTELVSNENGICIFKANVLDEEGKVIGTGYAYEKENSTYINKTSYIENCETSAVGRALGLCGFGIDTSVASYEEVANAIEQQEQNKQLSKNGAENLLAVMQMKGLSDETITETLNKNYGVSTVYELTEGQRVQILRNLNKG